MVCTLLSSANTTTPSIFLSRITRRAWRRIRFSVAWRSAQPWGMLSGKGIWTKVKPERARRDAVALVVPPASTTIHVSG
uniref:Pglcat8 n=1 Tax=Arundo donax TaxID=35708 RepID=A0A0A9GGQ4_ARUDO